jgi:glycosyltransferase involved in cell wall biosynthesis
MKIGVIGTRGFPDIQGGIETHCMELYTRIARTSGNLITVYRRKPYLNSLNRDAKFDNIRFVDFSVPKSKFLETFLHSFISTLHALFQRYDIVHYHNTGPGFFIPLLVFSRAKVVFTYHNVSYTQKKWNPAAKKFLYLSEKISLNNSDYVIFISEVIKGEMLNKYSVGNYKVIFNGVCHPEISTQSDYLESLGLEKHKYAIAVGRFLEEKGFDYLIRSFRKTNTSEYKLVLAGDTDYPTDYSKKLKALAMENDVVLTGFIKGEKLNQLFSHAKLFIMSSFEEGLPIALLEAMSYNIDVLVSNIPANLQIGLNQDDYFKVGDEEDLKSKITEKLSENKKRFFSEILSVRFNWDKIAIETNNIYQQLTLKNETKSRNNRAG